jgi:hypothetical protein
MPLYLTTTTQNVEIFDLGDAFVHHPITNKDISEFGIERLRNSTSLGKLIDDGLIILKDKFLNVLTSSTLKLLDFDNF